MTEPDRLQGERFDWIPDALVDEAVEAWHVMPRPLGLDDQMRFILATVLPRYRQLVLMEMVPPGSMDPMSAENFKIIDGKFGELIEGQKDLYVRMSELDRIVLAHLEGHGRLDA